MSINLTRQIKNLPGELLKHLYMSPTTQPARLVFRHHRGNKHMAIIILSTFSDPKNKYKKAYKMDQEYIRKAKVAFDLFKNVLNFDQVLLLRDYSKA